MALQVFLGAAPVGWIEPEGDGFVFRFEESYAAMTPRPVLGLAFEDLALAEARVTDPRRLPSFFRNYLPEGLLLSLVKNAVPTFVDRDYHMLAYLGEDLPGDIRVRSDELLPETEVEYATVDERGIPPLRFSLAGVQLKLSALRGAERVTIPLRGEGGDWIAKFPSRSYPGLPENEHAMMGWAARCGLRVPEHTLWPCDKVAGTLPTGYAPTGPKLFLVRRYDRDQGRRIHQEDFAQVLGVDPERKYGLGSGLVDDTLHLATVANIVRHRCGQTDSDELLRRVAFTVLSGNGDMHLKNWSLYYPDPTRPCLSPVYDFVSTVEYTPGAEFLGLGMCEPSDRSMTKIGLEHFERVARSIHDDPTRVRALIREFVGRALSTWSELSAEGTASRSTVRAIADWHSRLVLVRECAP